MFQNHVKQNRIIVILLLIIVIGFTILSFTSLLNQSLSAHPVNTIHYVAPTSCGISPCYNTIQAAVNAAATGDEVRIAAGNYTQINHIGGLKQIVYINKTIHIRGGFSTGNWNSPDPDIYTTTLDAQNNGRAIYITGNISPVIEGLKITNGNANGLGGDPWFGHGAGGGIYIITATATISNNQISNNNASSYFGGGIYLNKSQSLIIGNTINNNSAGDGGGVGIWFGNNSLVSNHISNNSNSGIWLYGFTGTFSHNIISNNNSNDYGGGIQLYYGGAHFDNNEITGNTADYYGGGISLNTYSVGYFDGDLITGNSAGNDGGGIYVNWHSKSNLNNTVIANNDANSLGSGLYVNNGVVNSIHSTFARNSNGDGRAIYVTDKDDLYSTTRLTNTIIADHNIGIQATAGNTVTANSILWHNTPITLSHDSGALVSIQNQITGDPAFSADGYHLTNNSAARDFGIKTDVSFDIDNEFRADGLPDLGVDEIIPTLSINHKTGAPGSIFTVNGINFPANKTTTVTLNGRFLGTEPTDSNGELTFLLDASAAEEGAYMATVKVNPSADLWFSIDSTAPTHTPDGSGTIYSIPSGIGFDEFSFLPGIVR